MISINPAINAFHAAYCEAAGYSLPMLPAFERWYFNAHQLGITPEGLAMCLRERKRLNAQGTSFHRGVFLRNLIRDEEDIAIVIEEIAALQAKGRIKVMDPARASVLESTGRPTTPPTPEARHIADTDVIKAMEALRKAAG